MGGNYMRKYGKCINLNYQTRCYITFNIWVMKMILCWVKSAKFDAKIQFFAIFRVHYKNHTTLKLGAGARLG